MSRSIGFLVVAVTLLASIDQARLFDDVATGYLPLRDSVAWFPHYAKDVQAIMVANPLPQEPSLMVDAIRSKLDLATKPSERDFFTQLLNLSDDKAECTLYMSRCVLATLALAPADDSQNYVAYVKLFGKTKFGSCAQHTAEEFERAQTKLDERVERELDELFIAYNGAPKESTTSELYEAAKKMNFVSDDYHVNQMASVSKKYMPRGAKVNLDLNTHGHLNLFIQNWCVQMQQPLESVLVTFNLARAFGAEVSTEQLPPRFLKLNEYNRVCLTWQENRNSAEANLRRQLGVIEIKPKGYTQNDAISQGKTKTRCKWFKCFTS